VLESAGVPIPDLLRDLLVARGPSGHEGPAARVWRDAAAAFAEVHSDTLGTSFARVRASAAEGAPTLAVVGHIDEIGIAITNVEESGLLSISAIGGFQPDVLVGQRVTISGRDGDLPGVIGRRMIAPDKRSEEGKVALSDLHIDIGAKDGDDARTLVRVGDSAVWRGDPLELPNGRFVSKSMDNRLGAYVALEVARRVAEAGGVEVDVVGVAAVQEEIGYYGSRTAAFSLDPDFGIAIDVTYATDVPGGDPKAAGKIELGSGAAIGRGPILNAGVVELLATAAEEEGIAHTFEVATNRTYTDADAVHVSRSGVPTGLVSIPLRYMHSPGELATLDDLEAVIALVVAFAHRLTRETSFLR
jgi:putative aminopeptidase FrvX